MPIAKKFPIATPNAPKAPPAAPAGGGQAAQQQHAGVQAGQVLAGGAPRPGLRRPDPKMGEPYGGVTPGDPMSFKTHALVGRRKADGHLLLIKSWDHCPTKAEIDEAKKDTKFPYVQFALVNAVGIWDAVEQEPQPIWTARA